MQGADRVGFSLVLRQGKPASAHQPAQDDVGEHMDELRRTQASELNRVSSHSSRRGCGPSSSRVPLLPHTPRYEEVDICSHEAPRPSMSAAESIESETRSLGLDKPILFRTRTTTGPSATRHYSDSIASFHAVRTRANPDCNLAAAVATNTSESAVAIIPSA